MIKSANTVESSFIWKFLERISVQGIQFVIQIILARLLSPEHYGALAIMLIFVNLSNVVIQNGFNTSLIQGKDVDDEDFSSVFWLLFGLSAAMYIVLFLLAPVLTACYKMPYLLAPFRVLALIMIPGALNSVQLAIIRRRLDFRKEFTSNITAIVIAGSIGIACAFAGFGLWSLVIQAFLNTSIACVVMWNVVGWRPTFVFNILKIKRLFSYGYKIVLAGLLDTLSTNLSGLIIGIKYNASALGFFSRGSHFPNAIMGAINTTVQSVMLPVLSASQDDKGKAKQLMRKSIMLSCYLVFPMMAGLAGIAKPLIQILLTDKWLECVPYMQIFCFIYAFWPVHSCNLQAINAMGRSDIFLKLEVIKKMVTWFNLGTAVFYFDTPLAIAAIGILSTVLCSFLNCYPNKYLLKYSFKEQIRDIIPYFLLSITMFILLNLASNSMASNVLNLTILIISGVLYYFFGSFLFKMEAYNLVLLKIKERFRS